MILRRPSSGARAGWALALAVFATVLLTALVGRHPYFMPSRSPTAVRSELAIAIFGTIVFLTVRALGGRRPALTLYGLLLCALLLRTVATTTGGIRLVGDQPPADRQAVTDLTGPPSGWMFQAPIVKQSDQRVLVDGRVQQRYSYLLVSVPQHLEAGSYLVAEGDLREGGFSIGLQQANNWVVYQTVVDAGGFRTSLRVPRDGSYQLVLANAVSTDTSRNLVEFSSLGVVR